MVLFPSQVCLVNMLAWSRVCSRPVSSAKAAATSQRGRGRRGAASQSRSRSAPRSATLARLCSDDSYWKRRIWRSMTQKDQLLGRSKWDKCASDPRPPHTRQKYEQKSGQNMTPKCWNRAKLDSFGAIFLFIFLPCMWGGFQIIPHKREMKERGVFALE